jgi:hypothetical protein
MKSPVKNSAQSPIKRSALKQLLQDKEGNYNLREVVTALFVIILMISWVAHQFLGYKSAEYMFYTFASLVGAGGFGYSLERKTFTNHEKS